MTLEKPTLLSRLEELERKEGAAALAEIVSMLRESSWSLRRRVVDHLCRRPESFEALQSFVAGAPWFSKVDVCFVLQELSDPRAFPLLLEEVLDRNVSVQKSAAEALRSLAERHGDENLRCALEPFPRAKQRAALARLGHQVPDLAARLVEGIPPATFHDLGVDDAEGEDEVVLKRFRAWLAAVREGAILR